MKRLLTIVILLFLISCDNPKTTKVNALPVNNEIELSSLAVKSFQNIFESISFDNHYYNFEKAYLITPNFNYNFIKESDTFNFSYFKLTEGSNSLIIAVNYQDCFASVLEKHRGFEYPNISTIHPNDFRWLNKEKITTNFNCINSDTVKIRSCSYDKNILGHWKIDSTFSNWSNNIPNDEIKKIVIDKSKILINDTLSLKYKQAGKYLLFDNSDDYLYKIFVNFDKMIVTSRFNNNLTTFYCSKSK